jgi:hypothetical protein
MNLRWSGVILLVVGAPLVLAQEGLRGEYFNTTTLSGTPVTRVDPEINFNWLQGSPIAGVGIDRFAVRWTGEVTPLYSEIYTFVTVSDDGVRLWVDGERIINNWSPHLPTTDAGSIYLKAGQAHSIQLEFFDLTVDALISLSWSSPRQSLQIIPRSQLRLWPLFQNRPPNTPIILAPAAADLTLDAAEPLIRTDGFSDPDTGNIHRCSEWEIRNAASSERVWFAVCTNATNLLSIRLADGVFENSHSKRTTLELHGEYVLRVRHKDGSQDPASEWSNWAERRFNTARPLFTIVPPGAFWRYRDDRVDQGTAWRGTNFNDGAWPLGQAQFGFGDGDEVTITCCSSGLRPITTYFRRPFVLANLSLITNLTGRLLRDDGGVVYLNGQEIFRSNLDPGISVFYGTLAASATEADEFYNFHPFNVPLSRLRQGTNWLAVEIHQSSSTSSDLSFDFELIAEVTSSPGALRVTREGSDCIVLSWDDPGTILEQSSGALGRWSPVLPRAESPFHACGISSVTFYRLRRQ